MARKKLSEFKAKQLLTEAIDLPYTSVLVNNEHPYSPEKLDGEKTYVVKVDEGIKKRMKQGLVFLKQRPGEIPQALEKLREKGFSNFIIEPFIEHTSEEEKYLSLSLTRSGIEVLYSEKGGIDIEENQDAIKHFVIDVDAKHSDVEDITNALGISAKDFSEIIALFQKYHFTLLEINPFVVTKGGETYCLDIAAEVDSAAEFFVDGKWTSSDFRQSNSREKTPEEEAIDELSQKSQASFKLDVLNPNGSVFMLLSGGGASIVLADEAYNLGRGKDLANYGEYSGNPNGEEVYLYTKNLLVLLLKSTAEKKVLVIAGGVANFTDVRKTFAGIIRAIDNVKEQLREQHIKVFVRRGGPHQREGLAAMKDFLEKEDLLGNVSGPEMPLQKVVTLALQTL